MALTTKLFRNNTSQAVRLPKAVAFPEGVEEVEIRAVGSSRVITPKDKMERWRVGIDKAFGAIPDFPDRVQPPAEIRDSF